MSRTLALALAGALSGCATIVQGPMQRVAFETQPPGATIRADMQTCTTPCSLRLKRNRNVVAQIHKDGYAGESVFVRYELDPWILGNLAFLMFAPVGGAVDVVSGAGFQLYPPMVSIPLRPMEERSVPQDRREPLRPPEKIPDEKGPARPEDWKPIPGEAI